MLKLSQSNEFSGISKSLCLGAGSLFPQMTMTHIWLAEQMQEGRVVIPTIKLAMKPTFGEAS